MAPRFSVLLPTHNRPDVLELAIRSVRAQTLTDWELLVVGDGCTDHTASVVQGFSDPRIRWFDLPKAAGFGYANRNIALAQATGDLVAFLGHDNLLLSDHLERLSGAFRRPTVQLAYSRPVFAQDDGLMVPLFVNLTVRPMMKEFMTSRNTIPANCVAHRRSALDRVGMWPLEVESAGDWHLWKRIINAFGHKSVHLVPVPTCLHFRACWRKETGWGPEPLAYLTALRDKGGYWPQQLDLRLAPHKLPQAQVWSLMSMNLPDFSKRLRKGTSLLHDYLAWSAGLRGNSP